MLSRLEDELELTPGASTELLIFLLVVEDGTVARVISSIMLIQSLIYNLVAAAMQCDFNLLVK